MNSTFNHGVTLFLDCQPPMYCKYLMINHFSFFTDNCQGKLSTCSLGGKWGASNAMYFVIKLTQLYQVTYYQSKWGLRPVKELLSNVPWHSVVSASHTHTHSYTHIHTQSTLTYHLGGVEHHDTSFRSKCNSTQDMYCELHLPLGLQLMILLIIN